MTRNLYKPYKANNPRTVRGAKKRNWFVVDVPFDVLTRKQVSWLGLELWAERHSEGYWVSSYMNREFAFESEQDASKFIVQWTWIA